MILTLTFNFKESECQVYSFIGKSGVRFYGSLLKSYILPQNYKKLKTV